MARRNGCRTYDPPPPVEDQLAALESGEFFAQEFAEALAEKASAEATDPELAAALARFGIEAEA